MSITADEMAACWCGRSPTGKCDGSHTFTDEQWAEINYEYKGEEMKRITINNSIGDIILNLRRRAKFYGKEKERVPLDNYYDINKAYFIQFGINKEKIHRKQKIDFELKDYQKDQKVIYYRVNLSNNIRAHIAFMKFLNWENFVCETYGQEFQFDLLDNNAYCVPTNSGLDAMSSFIDLPNAV